MVVLAVGFGLERGDPRRVSYWSDADGLDGIAPGTPVAVIGFGEAVWPMCSASVCRGSARTAWSNWCVACRAGAGAARRMAKDSLYGDAAQRTAIRGTPRAGRIEELSDAVEASKATLPKVTLAGSGHLYGPGSAVLNQFLVSQLRQACGDDAFKLEIGACVTHKAPQETDGGVFRSDARPELTFAGIALRFGPEPAYKRISPLADWKVGDERRAHWREMLQSLDATRISIWDHGAK